MTTGNAQKISPRPLRDVNFGHLGITVDHGKDGVMYVRPADPLGPFPERAGDPLIHWAQHRPEAIFVAERDAAGGWHTVTYGEAYKIARAIGSGLIARGLSADKPVLVLSGNSVDHALMALGCLLVGVPYCPLSTAYSLVSQDFGKLKYTIGLLTPGLVFADDGSAFGRAIAAQVAADTEVVIARNPPADRPVTSFATLCQTPDHPDLDKTIAAINPDTIAKFLMTSGSTGNPKGVINTHRMLCANQVMVRDTMAFLKDEPPVIVDWLPWNHTFGGNHNFGLVLFNGGSLYIDDGKPLPGAIAATVRNLREVSPTVYFNVPKGFESLLPYLREDADLRKSLFRRLKATFFAGAGLSAHVWNAFDDIAIMETGTRLPMLTGLGSTETAPFSMSASPLTSRSGHVGVPVPGNDIKLVPVDGKLECRVRGPNVTPGYWRQPDLTAKAFDEEGFYKFGDAVKPVDPNDFSKGFDFDGRISEDFKLASGTWVSVGPLRARFIAATAPYIRDVVIAGINQDSIAAIAVPDIDACRAACPHLEATATADDVVRDPVLVRDFRAKLRAFAKTATGSATRIERAVILGGLLSIDKGEVTDKGSINQRAVLEHRAALVDDLYLDHPPAHVITIHQQD